MTVVKLSSRLTTPFVATKELPELSDNKQKLFVRKWATRNKVEVTCIKRLHFSLPNVWVVHTKLKEVKCVVQVFHDGTVKIYEGAKV